MKLEYDFEYCELVIMYNGKKMALSFDTKEEMLSYSPKQALDDIRDAIVNDFI